MSINIYEKVNYIPGSPTNSDYSDTTSEDGLMQHYNEKAASIEPTHLPISPVPYQSRTILNVVYIMINVFAAVAIVFANKSIMSHEQLSGMPITIVVFHSICTTLLLHILSRPQIAFFEAKTLPVRSILPLAAGFGLYVILGLCSIAYNPVPIYQLGKILNGPVVALLNMIFFRDSIELTKTLSIGTICSGVGLTIKGDWESVTALGLIIVILSTIAAAMYQIWIGQMHKRLDLSSSQLLYNQAPISVMLLLPAIPLLDNFTAPWNMPREAVLGVLLTGVLASIVNLSQFLVIQNTSALTFNVVSNLKTCCILVTAWIMQGKNPALIDCAGVGLTMLGTVWYSSISLMQQRPKAASCSV